MFGSWGSGVGGIFETVQKQEIRLSAASTFLSTGVQYTSIGGTSCNSSNECASGYFCNGNGVCQQLNSGTSNGNSCGTNSTPDRGTCSDGNCTSSGCSPKADCCGPRYCRYSPGPNNTPVVYCNCGYPPKQGSCTTFCSSYYATTGNLNGGCTKEQTCDECSYCDDGLCVESNNYIPCHCEGAGNYSVPACYKCNENGVVVPAPETCSYCYQLYNFDCGCATLNKTCCYNSLQIQEMSRNGIVPIEKCREEAAKSCAEICPSAPTDVCGVNEGECTSKTRTYGGNCGCTQWFNSETGRTEMKCPGTNTCNPGEISRITGFLQAPGNNACTVFYECCGADTSKQCKSDADCPLKYKCGTATAENCDGCYPDPYAGCSLPALGPNERYGIQTNCPWSAFGCPGSCFCTNVCSLSVGPGDPGFMACPMFGNIYYADGYYNPNRVITRYSGSSCSAPSDVIIPNPVSDYRLKSNVRQVTDALERVAKLKPRVFVSPTKANLTISGFVPEEVDGISPWAVIGDKATLPDGSEAFRFVHDARLAPLLMAALIEVYKQIDALREDMVYLKDAID